MPRKAHPINPKTALRLTALIRQEDITQKKLAEDAHLSENLVSRLVQGKSALTAATAAEINRAYPAYSVPYLLGEDDFPSVEQKHLAMAAFGVSVANKQRKAVERFIRDLGYTIVPNETYSAYQNNKKGVSDASDHTLTVNDIPGTHDVFFYGEPQGTCSRRAAEEAYRTILAFTEFTLSRLGRE